LIINVFLYTFSKLFANDEFLWKTKWINDLVSEIIPLMIFGVLVLFLNSSNLKEEEVTIHELESESEYNSHNFSSSRIGPSARPVDIR
jgi:hypothetical protein